MTDKTKTNLETKVKQVHLLDTATQDLLASVRNKNAKAIKWFIVCWTLLFAVGVFGIWKQNQIANSNKNHIDCIIKDLSTQLPAGAKARYIEYQTRLSADCKIKFN